MINKLIFKNMFFQINSGSKLVVKSERMDRRVLQRNQITEKLLIFYEKVKSVFHNLFLTMGPFSSTFLSAESFKAIRQNTSV